MICGKMVMYPLQLANLTLPSDIRWTMISEGLSLQECELFRGLTKDELSKLKHLCSDRVVVQDSTLFTEGREATHLYVVTEGQIALQKAMRAPHSRPSRRATIGICRAGDIAGWSSLVEPYKYTLSAVAWQPSKLIRIDSVTLRRALDIYPDMGYKVMKALSAIIASRLRQITTTLINERESFLSRM